MNEEATIRRGVRNARYSTIPNHVFEDVRLSMEARWLLGYLLSKPDNWTVIVGDIAKRGACGRDKARRMINELVSVGYAEKEQPREGGRFSALSLVIYDEPSNGVAFLPQTENPSTVNPSTVKPSTVNAALVNTDVQVITEDKFERERASEDEGREESRKALERAFEKAWQKWPTSVGDSRPTALNAWMTLTAEERALAVEETERYVTEVKATGRKLLCSHAVYLKEKRWTYLQPRTEAKKAESIDAPAFGALWSVARFKQLVTGPRVPFGDFTHVQKHLIASGHSEDKLRRESVAKTGWPQINAMHERAVNHQGVVVSAALEGFKDLVEAVPVASERFVEWKSHHEQVGWPWIPDPGKQPVVYFPVGGPDGLKRFEQAVLGNDHDGSR